MKRVVVTGMGIVSCLGNDKESVTDALRNGRSGVKFKEEYKEMGLRSQIAGQVDVDIVEHIEPKALRFMGAAAAYAYIAMGQAIKDSGLTGDQVSNPRTGLVAGSGGISTLHHVKAVDILREKGVKRIGPFMVPKVMTSTVSACLGTSYKIKGVCYSMASACATSAHCIGNAMEQIQLGKQDIVFAGGGEEENWTLTMLFDAMGALSTKYNDTPETASRAFDATRDGFVIAGGAGMIVLEDYEHAKKRGAKIYAELTGYGATADGDDMVVPSGEGAVRCMQIAMATTHGSVDYINAHGTSTKVGDIAEMLAVKEVFGMNHPVIGSTKSLTGHSLGGAGVQEAIYSLLMLENDFIAESINITRLDEKLEGMNIARALKENAGLKTVMSNSFGFGGSNATLIFQKMD